jgi:Flp pilus assembly protein TadG
LAGKHQSFATDENGATMVEMAIVASLLFIVVLGFVDFGYAFYQWNAANKAVQVGARLARVSTPVPSGLLSESSTSDPTKVGLPVPAGTYDYVCTASAAGTASCSCAAGTCEDITVVQQGQDAFNLIYAGDDGVCDGAANPGRPGMCDFFPRLQKNNVKIEYIATGLGYWTRPGGPVPTIKVSLQNLTFQFYFLGGLLGFNDIDIPSMVSSVTGEDLDSNGP